MTKNYMNFAQNKESEKVPRIYIRRNVGEQPTIFTPILLTFIL